MTFTHGGLIYIALSRAPIYPKNAMPASRDRVSRGDHGNDTPIFTGNNPTIAFTALHCDDRRPHRRTTIA